MHISSRRLFISCIFMALVFKVLVMAVSAYSYDLLYMVKGSIVTPGRGMRLGTYWTYLLGGLYRFWLLLPVEHVGLENWFRSKPFPIAFGDFLLISILKLPILLLDLACGYIIYKIALLERGESSALRAFTIWICNPLVTLTAEMDGSNDILIATLALATAYFFIRGSPGSSSLALTAGVAAKLYAILVAPVLILFSTRRRAFAVASASILGAAIYILWTTKSGLGSLLSTLLNYTPLTFAASEALLTPYDSRIGLATFSGFLYFYLVYRFWRGGDVIDALFGFLLVYMAFLNWWPPYLLLLLPFITLELSKGRGGKVYMILILVTISLYILCQANEFGLVGGNASFYIWNYHPWMEKASGHLIRFSSDVTVKLVVAPILRSAYTALSIIYGLRLLLWNSPELKALFARMKISPSRLVPSLRAASFKTAIEGGDVHPVAHGEGMETKDGQPRTSLTSV
jgi:hypothetical protein